MLTVGLTGGIASGKSVVARRLSELGAVLIDADVLAREVVEPGTPGFEQVVEAFGTGVLDHEGALDRGALGEIVFNDKTSLERLNAIIHPQVRAESARRVTGAPGDSIVVQDIPLLVETGQQSSFHVVIVVETPAAVRVARMVSDRHMSRDEAEARMASQASDQQRRAAADALIDNGGSLQDVRVAVDRLWQDRLIPCEANLRAGAVARIAGPAVLSRPDPSWPLAADRIGARLRRAGGPTVLGVDHIGSTAITGMPAKDVIDLQVTVADLDEADALGESFTKAGFPRVDGVWADHPKPCDPDPEHWRKRLHGSGDPGRLANIHLRVVGSPGRAFALAFRDWLRDDPDAAAAYAARKHALAGMHSNDDSTKGYAQAKDSWFDDYAYPRMRAWAAETGWQEPDRS